MLRSTSLAPPPTEEQEERERRIAAYREYVKRLDADAADILERVADDARAHAARMLVVGDELSDRVRLSAVNRFAREHQRQPTDAELQSIHREAEESYVRGCGEAAVQRRLATVRRVLEDRGLPSEAFTFDR
jgi:K+-sensing histidine kinase KdpD